MLCRGHPATTCLCQKRSALGSPIDSSGKPSIHAAPASARVASGGLARRSSAQRQQVCGEAAAGGGGAPPHCLLVLVGRHLGQTLPEGCGAPRRLLHQHHGHRQQRALPPRWRHKPSNVCPDPRAFITSYQAIGTPIFTELVAVGQQDSLSEERGTTRRLRLRRPKLKPTCTLTSACHSEAGVGASPGPAACSAAAHLTTRAARPIGFLRQDTWSGLYSLPLHFQVSNIRCVVKLSGPAPGARSRRGPPAAAAAARWPPAAPWRRRRCPPPSPPRTSRAGCTTPPAAASPVASCPNLNTAG